MTALLLEVSRLVDRLAAGRHPTGIDRVGLAYVAHYATRARAVVQWAGRAHVLPAAESRALFAWLLAPRPARRGLVLAAAGLIHSQFVAVPRGATLLHTGHTGLERPALQRLVRRHDLRCLVLIHDLIPITHPRFCRAGEAVRHAARLRGALALATGILCVSEVVRLSLVQWAEEAGLALPPLRVLTLAPSPLPSPQVGVPLPARPYYLVVGTLEPRKNHRLLLEAWVMLEARLGPRTPLLVVLGQPGWLCEGLLEELAAAERRGHVHLLTASNDATLAALLQGAEALLMPALVEGYGLPVVEALAAGVPVLASDLPVFREIAGDYPEYLPPADPAAWAGRIESGMTREHRTRLEAYVPPDWSAHFSALEDFLATLPPGLVHALEFSGWKRPHVRSALSPSAVKFIADVAAVPAGATLAVWGAGRPSALPEGVRLLQLEDGFLRSVGLGAELIRPLSWVVDDCGLYYDATRPSRLERLLATAEFTPEEIARAARLRARLVNAGLTKYNLDAPRWMRPADVSRVVLVVGQVESDASLRLGSPVVRTNDDLIAAVRALEPAAWLVYKPHPDVVAGLRAGSVSPVGTAVDEVVGEVELDALLRAVDEVHVMTSLTGFEALLRGVSVTCHGLPFYAGWGLTRDLVPAPRRGRRLSLDELVAAALLRYPVYLGQKPGSTRTAEEAVEALITWRLEQRRRGGRWWQPLWRALLRRVVGVR